MGPWQHPRSLAWTHLKWSIACLPPGRSLPCWRSTRMTHTCRLSSQPLQHRVSCHKCPHQLVCIHRKCQLSWCLCDSLRFAPYSLKCFKTVHAWCSALKSMIEWHAYTHFMTACFLASGSSIRSLKTRNVCCKVPLEKACIKDPCSLKTHMESKQVQIFADTNINFLIGSVHNLSDPVVYCYSHKDACMRSYIGLNCFFAYFWFHVSEVMPHLLLMESVMQPKCFHLSCEDVSTIAKEGSASKVIESNRNSVCTVEVNPCRLIWRASDSDMGAVTSMLRSMPTSSPAIGAASWNVSDMSLTGTEGSHVGVLPHEPAELEDNATCVYLSGLCSFGVAILKYSINSMSHSFVKASASTHNSSF